MWGAAAEEVEAANCLWGIYERSTCLSRSRHAFQSRDSPALSKKWRESRRRCLPKRRPCLVIRLSFNEFHLQGRAGWWSGGPVVVVWCGGLTVSVRRSTHTRGLGDVSCNWLRLATQGAVPRLCGWAGQGGRKVAGQRFEKYAYCVRCRALAPPVWPLDRGWCRHHVDAAGRPPTKV